MSITFEPAVYNPTVIELPSGHRFLSEADQLKSWEDDDCPIPYVSLNRSSMAEICPLLGISSDDPEGAIFELDDLYQRVVKVLTGNRLIEFSCASDLILSSSDDDGCLVLQGTTSPLEEKLEKILKLIAWTEEHYQSLGRIIVS